MRIVFSGGGTAGHINPALALAAGIRARRPETEILFCGSAGGMEEKLVTRAGYPIRTIPMQGLSRKISPAGLLHNAKTLYYTASAIPAAAKILKEFAPDAVIGTGGFACYPYLRAACHLRIPTMIHESNALAGKTTLALEETCDRILLGFDSARTAFRHPDRPIWTGNPLTADMNMNRAVVREKYGIDPEVPLVLSAWGSLGAREMNRITADFLACAQNDPSFRFIHATGSYGYKWFPQMLKDRGIDRPNTDVCEYIYGLPELMQGADLILCRAGAMTMSEVCAAGIPAIIVPSPNVAENHQEKNARALEAAGAACVILEKECTGRKLYETVRALLDDPARRAGMRAGGLSMAIYDAEERIWDVLTELLKQKRQIRTE